MKNVDYVPGSWEVLGGLGQVLDFSWAIEKTLQLFNCQDRPFVAVKMDQDGLRWPWQQSTSWSCAPGSSTGPQVLRTDNYAVHMAGKASFSLRLRLPNQDTGMLRPKML